MDGLHWYKTTAAEDPTNPVWEPEEEDETAAWRLPEASHHVLIPLKELDLDLQACSFVSELCLFVYSSAPSQKLNRHVLGSRRLSFRGI